MSIVENAVAWALSVAGSPSHAYDSVRRWGPGYDGASFVIAAYQECGVPVKSAGATAPGNMRSAFLRCGFADVLDDINRYTAEGLCLGDVLLNTEEHAALYLGGGRLVQADGARRCIAPGEYFNYPWDAVLRLREESEPRDGREINTGKGETAGNAPPFSPGEEQ